MERLQEAADSLLDMGSHPMDTDHLEERDSLENRDHPGIHHFQEELVTAKAAFPVEDIDYQRIALQKRDLAV
jgi:hypothetical protein